MRCVACMRKKVSATLNKAHVSSSNTNYMALDLEEMKKKIDEFLANITQEEINKYFPPDTRPKGWLSIEEYLPLMCAIDIVQGYTLYKVKDKNGNEFESAVSDHNNWYYYAKEEGITHWWNGE